MRKIKLFLSLLMVMLLSVGNVWAVDPVTVKSTFSKATTPSDNQVTDLESAVTWDISTDEAVGSPSYTVGSADSKEGLKFGASKNAYYGKIDLSTDYFKNYNVKSVKLYVKNNGSKIGTLTAKQGSVTIGTQSNTSATNAWNEMTASGTTGEGGILTVSYEVAQASYINYIEVTYEVPVSTDCESKITITKAANPANGTFEIDNSGEVCIDEGNVTVNVTATPADHYHLASVTTTGSVGTIGSIAGNTCEIIDIDADTEIGVTFAEDTKYVVTWNVNGNEDTKTNVYAGEKPVFPSNPSSCDATSTTFIGWATAPWTGKLADLSAKTVYTSADAMPAVSSAVTYYAVFAKSSGSASELFSWAGGGKEALLAIEGIVSSSLDADYAASHSPYQVKWNGDGKYLIIPVSAQPGKLSVGFKMIGGATTSTVDVQESTATDGEFTTVETLSISGSSNDIVNVETTKAFKSTTRAIKLLYHKGSNVGLGPISIEGAVSYEDYMTTCCTQYNVNIAAGIENGSVSADPASACEGATITLTFTPALNYHLSAWTLNGEAQDIAENTFTMPAAAVTVSATFAEDACDPLATPVVEVSDKAYPYDAVKLAWSAIDNADAYKVYIYDAEDNELEHNDAVSGVEYTIGQALSASTTYKYSVQAVSNTPATYCPSEAAAGSFVTEALPTAHLTLIALDEEQQASGDYSILTPFELPSTAASCAKTFMGWDADPDCATIPTYAKGAEFTFQNTDPVTLYAVYADETPGAAALTKLGSGATFADGDKLVIAAKGTNFGIYFENAGSAYVKNWEFAGADPVLSELTDTKKILTLVKSGDNWKFGDATNGYFYSSSSNNLEISTTNFSEFNSFVWNNTEAAFTITKTDNRYLNCRTDLTSSNANLWRFNGTNTNSGSPFLYVYKYAVAASTFSNYSTTCVAAPTAEPASASIAVAAAGANSTLGVTYNNVNLAGVSVALFNDAACTIAFDGEWLTATIEGDDKHIAYTIAENTAYAARTAYIKLTAPETSGAANPAVVVIPVEQEAKALVFASLAELVNANIATGTDVTVTFENEVITNDQYISQGTKRAGVFLTTKANNKAIEIFYNKGTTVVPTEWVVGGKLSATAKTFTWTDFNGQWELVPLGNDWTWDNGDLAYTAPKTVSSVVVTGAPDKKNYVDGEKFAPAGLTVTINYNDDTYEVNPVGVTFACTPERVAKSDEPVSVSVVATFNEIESEAFEVTGLTVGDIQPKTIAQFITDGGGRCYLEGIVSGNVNTNYGNFDLTDNSGTIYVYGSDVFDDHGVAQGDKVKVIAEEYLLYQKAGNPDKDEALNVEFVSVKKATTIAIEDINMEVGNELLLSNIVATVTPAAAQSAEIAYEVSEGSAVEIEEGKIKAIAEGEATITASIAEGEGYLAGSKTFTVTVTAPDLRHIANASAFEAVSGDMTPTDIKFEAFKGDGTTEPIVKDENIRLYKPASGKSTGGYLTLTAKVGCTIDQVQITFNDNATAAYCKDDAELPTEAFITGQTELLTPAALGAQSVSIVNLKNGSIDVNAIKVWYNGEPLPIDHYFLGGTYPTEFVQYDAFDYTGLQVFAAYDVQETIKEEIFDFTAEADLMTAGNKKAEVYRGENKIAEYDITVNESQKQNPDLAYTPSEETITLGDAWTAPEFSNLLNVDGITFSTSNNKVAKVTSAGVITLEGGCGTAVITAHFDATDDYIESTATYTITVNEPAENLAGKWEIVTEVLPGMRIIIANEAAKTMGVQNSNNRAAVESTVDGDGILAPANGTKTFLVVETETEGQYALRALNGNYIYAASNSSNNLKEQATIDNNAKWSFNFAEDGVATIKANGANSHNLIRYNSGSDLFSCYASGQDAVYVYAWKPYTRTVSGNYGTICLPNGGKMLNGALYEIAEMDYQDNKPYKIYFDEVEGGVMVAGKPYIFKPNDGETTLRVVYTDAANAEEGHYKGLYGKYSKTLLTKDDGNYILKNNQYYYVNSDDVYCGENRAYIKLAEVPMYDSNKPSHSPRRIALNVNSEQVATDIDALNASETPVKVLINGEIFIIRGEKMYDVTGKLVK